MLKKYKPLYAIVASCLVGLVIALIAFLSSKAKKKDPEKWIRKILTSEGFSPESVNLWVALSKHESGSYTNLLTRQYYNIFSMGVPSKRPSLRNGKVYMEGDKNWFSTYENYVECVKDLLLWIDYNSFPVDIKDASNFVTKLKNVGYFTANAEAYLAGLKRFMA